MHPQAHSAQLARLKKRLRLMIAALIGCVVLLIAFIAAVIFFYQLQAANPLTKSHTQLQLNLPENLMQKKTAIQNICLKRD